MPLNKTEANDDSMKSHLFNEEDVNQTIHGEEKVVSGQESEKDIKRKRKQEKRFSETSTSVAALEEDVSPNELLQEMSRKLAKSGTQHNQFMPKGLEKEIARTVEKHFQDEYKEKTEDSVVLSKDRKKEEAHLPNDLKKLLLEKQTNPQGKPTEAQKDSQGNLHTAQEMAKKPPLQAVLAQAAATELKKTEKQETGTADIETTEVVTKYLTTLAETILSPTHPKQDQARHLKEKLLTEGLSPSKLINLEGTIRRTLHQDFKQKLKDSFIKLALSYDNKITLEAIHKSNEMESLADLAGLKGVFGPGRSNMQEVKEDAKADMRNFIANELDNTIIESKAKGGSPEELVKAFNRFNEIASIAKFDSAAYMKTIGKKLEDWGAAGFRAPEIPGMIDTDPRRQSGGNSKRQQQQAPETSIDGLEDDIRTLFLQKSVQLDLRSNIEIRFKLNKLKKKLNSEPAYKKLQQEGEGLARLRLMDLFKEAMEEKATLPSLQGPAFALVQKKLKLALKGLKNLGASMPKKDMLAIRDQVNSSMFSIIKEEYLKLSVHLEANPGDVYLSRKKKEYLAILNRLKQESGLGEHIETSQTISFNSETTIIEAA